jgi:hypothetical protein
MSQSSAAQGTLAKAGETTQIKGFVSNGVYKNSFFGFELVLPKDWQVLGDEDTVAATGLTSEVLKTDNVNANKAIDRSFDLSTSLLFVSKEPLGAIENASLALSSARQPSKYVTAKMVLEATKSLLLKNPSTKLITDTQKVNIGGRDFQTMELEIQVRDVRVKVKYFMIMIREYSITAAISALDPKSWKVLDESVRSIAFDSK